MTNEISKFKNKGNVRLALKSYSEAWSLMFSTRLWLYLLFPLVLNVILIVAGNVAISDLIESLQQQILNKISFADSEYGLVRFLDKVMSGFIWLFMKAVFWVSFLFFGGYLIIIILSPVFSFLSESVEKKISANDYPFSFKQLFIDVIRGVRIAVRNLLIETGLVVLVFVISFIPVFGWIGAIFLFFVSSYFYGFSFIDYYVERQKLTVKDSVRLMRNNKWLVIGIGAVFSLSLFIPWIGITLSSFVAIWSVIAATIAMEKLNA